MMTQKTATRRVTESQSFAAAVGTTEQTKILVIDSDQLVHQQVRQLVAAENCMVDHASSTSEASTLLAGNQYDILIAEVGVDGIDAFGLIHGARRRDAELTAIAVSRRPTTELAINALKERVFDFLTKPLDQTELRLTILRATEIHRLNLAKTRLLEDARQKKIQLTQRVAELNALADAAGVLSSSGDLTRLLDAIMHLAAKVTMARHGSIMLLEAGDETLRIKATVGPEASRLLELSLPVGESIAGWVAQRGEALKIDDVEADPQFGRANRQGFETKSLLSVPLCTPNRVVGVINLSDKAGGEPFTDWDLRILRTFAAQVSMAISDAEQFQRNRRKLAEVTALYEISRKIPTVTGSDEVAEVIFDGLKAIVDCDTKIWFEPAHDTGELVAVRVDGALKNYHREQGLTIPAWTGAEPNEPALAGYIADALTKIVPASAAMSSILVSPVGTPAGKGEVETSPAFCGVIVLLAARPRAFDSYTERLVRVATAQAAALYERKSALLNASRLVTMGKMISEISHDLRKPLTNTKGSLQVICAKHGLPEKTVHVLQSIEQEIDRLAALVTELVDFSNPKKYQTRKGPIKPVIDRAYRLVEKDARQKKLQLVVELADDLPPFFHDENQMMEVCLNLILNAFESMEPGGSLTIRGLLQKCPDKQRDCICLEFEDTGCGIPRENLARIFERYYTGRENGTGLGLAIVERIVQAHEGKIEVESRPGRTVFRLLFPIER